MKVQFPKSVDKLVTHRRRKPYLYLLTGLISLGLFIGLVYNYSPSDQPIVFNYPLPLLPFFVLFLSSALFCLGTFAFKSKAHGFLIAAFVVIYLAFRLNNLTHPFFFILLFALFLSLELFVSYRK
jgi:hypothetical protein